MTHRPAFFGFSWQREGQVEAGVVTALVHNSEEKTEEADAAGVSTAAVLRDPERTRARATHLSHPSICPLSQAAHSTPTIPT